MRVHLLLLCLLAGCAMGPDYETPPFDYGEDWRNGSALESQAPENLWWKSYESPILEELIQEALAENNNLQNAFYKLEEARAQNLIAGSSLWPRLDYNVSYAREKKVNATGGSGKALGESVQNLTTLRSTWDVNWEVDIFGRLRRLDEAALAHEQETQALYDKVQLFLVADVVQAYEDGRRYTQKIKAMNALLGHKRDLVHYAQIRENGGLSDGGTTLKLQMELERQDAALRLLEKSLEQAVSRLAILTGKRPTKDLWPSPQGEMAIPESMENSLKLMLEAPASVIRRRPDVRAAERSLANYSARYSAAIASIFPNLTLGGLFGFQEIHSLPFEWIWRTAGQSFLRVLDFGQLIGNIDLAQAQERQAFYAYKETLVEAYGDVEVALADYSQSTLRLQDNRRAFEDLRMNANLVEDKMRAGLISHLEFSQASSEMWSTYLDYVDAFYDVSTAYARLAKALALDVTTPDVKEKKGSY